MDKRVFHNILNSLKDSNPDDILLIESIQQSFEKEVPAITDNEKRALRTFPEQFIPRKRLSNGEWSSQLHIWAENGVEDLLSIPPILLTHKNSQGDTVLMTLISYALGKYTEKINYDLIKKILLTDLAYEEATKEGDKAQTIEKNALEEPDIYGNSIIDWLIDYAYGRGMYENQPADNYLADILVSFANNSESDDEND